MNTVIRMLDVASYKTVANLSSDKPVTLVYGLNGTGKSTISNFLYDTTDPDYASCSATIDPSAKVLVYNQRFLREYFYEADSLKGIFGLSKENKDADQKIASAETDLAGLSQALEDTKSRIESEKATRKQQAEKAYERVWEIRKEYSGGDRVLEYCLKGLMGKKEVLFKHLSSIPKPDAKPDRDIAHIKKEVEAISGDSATKENPLPLISFGGTSIEQDEVFAATIVGNDDSPVAGLIQELQNSDWVRTGIEQYVVEPEGDGVAACPFCQEETLTTTLTEKIRSYFDGSFTKAINRISSLQSQYAAAVDQLPTVDTYGSHPLASEKLPELRLAVQKLSTVADENLKLIDRKRDLLGSPVSLVSTQAPVQELNALIAAVNAEIGQHNDKIANRVAELARLKDEFWSLMRWEYDQTISTWQGEDSAFSSRLKVETDSFNQSTKTIGEKRKVISDLQKTTVNIDAAIENINESLGQLGIGDFSIKKHSDLHYRIVRSGDSEASFTSLSEGEKMIISFLYFCEVCKDKQSADETTQRKIVVIDDPISSLSHVFVFNIGQLLKQDFFSSKQFDQVFVLTHSLYFFYELADTNHHRRSENQKLFRLTKNEAGSRIADMKYEEIQNDYQSYWAVVLDKDQHPAMVANCMRNIVEYFFGFVKKDSLNNVFQSPKLKENRYQAFCRYMDRESHSSGQNLFDFKEFDYEAFRDGLKLLFYAADYPEHYDKMEKSITG